MVQQQKTLETETAPWVVAFGQRLERARGRMGLTQAGLAGSDLSKSFISLLETARSYPSVDTLMLLARRVDASLAGLLLEPDDVRLDAALSLLALARGAAWRRPAWAARLLDTVGALLPDMPVRVRAEAATIGGMAAAAENRLDLVRRRAREAERLADRAGFLPGKADAVALRGYVEILHRDYAKAFDLLSQALALFRRGSALRSEPGVMALIWLANAAVRVGRPRAARRSCEKARALASRLHLPRIEGLALWGLGELAWSAGDLAEATGHMLAARDAFEASEDLFNLGEAAANLAALYRDQGRLDQSLALANQAVRVMNTLRHPRGRSHAGRELAHTLRVRGQLREAQAAARRALQDAGAARDRRQRALALVELGRLAARRGQRAAAGRCLREAHRVLRALGLTEAAAEVARDLALVRRGSTPEAEAAIYLTQAVGGADSAAGATEEKPRVRRRRAGRRSS